MTIEHAFCRKKIEKLADVPVFFPKFPKVQVFCPPPPRSRKRVECLPVRAGSDDHCGVETFVKDTILQKRKRTLICVGNENV